MAHSVLAKRLLNVGSALASFGKAALATFSGRQQEAPRRSSRAERPGENGDIPLAFAHFWRSHNVTQDIDKLWNYGNALTEDKLSMLNENRLQELMLAFKLELLDQMRVTAVWVKVHQYTVAAPDDYAALGLSTATSQKFALHGLPLKLSEFQGVGPVPTMTACKQLNVDLLDTALLLTELDRHQADVAASAPSPAKKRKLDNNRRESDDVWDDIEVAGDQYLTEVDARLERVAQGLERPSMWSGTGPTAAHTASLGIPEIGGRPSLLCKGLGVEVLTDQDQIRRVWCTDAGLFLVGRSGSGKSRTLMELLTSGEFGLYYTRHPSTSLGPHDLCALELRLANELDLMRQHLAEQLGISRHTPLEDLSPESREKLLEANRKKAEKYLQASRLARMRVFERLLEKNPSLEDLDWVYAQLNPHRKGEEMCRQTRRERDLFTPLFDIYASGASADVSMALRETEERVFKKRQIRRGCLVIDELPEGSQARTFKSSRDGSPPTDFLSHLMRPWNPSAGPPDQERWQLIGCGSGLSVTHIVGTRPSMLAKRCCRHEHTLTSFRGFETIDNFADYVWAIVGKARVSPETMEDAYYWFGQGPARLTTDFVEFLLMEPKYSAAETLTLLRDWHCYGRRPDGKAPLSEVQSLHDQLKAFLAASASSTRPIRVTALDGTVHTMHQLLENVIQQFVLTGEEVILEKEGEQQLMEAGVARLERSQNCGALAVARIGEPLAIATALEVLSEGKGEEYLIQKWSVRQMGLLRGRPSALGFVWEDCLVHQLQNWVQQPLESLGKHGVFGKQALPPEFSEPGEFVPFKVEGGRLVETERGSRVTPVIARAGDGTTLATWLLDSKGSLFLSPEQSAGSDLVGLARWNLRRRRVYKLCFVQAKLKEVVGDWEHAHATVVPESLYSCKAGAGRSEWREQRREEVLGLMKKYFGRKEGGTLQVIAAYPDKMSKVKRTAAFARVEGKDVLAIVDGGCPEAVWGKHLDDLRKVKGPAKG